MGKRLAKFRKECYSNYLKDIRVRVPAFPQEYTYPDGNPIRPVLPVQTTFNALMIIGAFPSARFETRDKKLIPVADNLAPFEPERYFDGRQTRTQASADSLDKNYFPQLGISRSEMWITDIAKVYLYQKKHLKNCRELYPEKTFTDTHRLFGKIAEASYDWIIREINICQPRLIITLGVVCAQVISRDKESTSKQLLDGKVRNINFENPTLIVHMAHPEARRKIPAWDERTRRQLKSLKPKLNEIL